MKKSPTKEQRLCGRKAIARVFSPSAQRSYLLGMAVRWLANDLGYNRVLFAPVKSLGKAVKRNQVKRWVKNDYCDLKVRLSRGYDIALLIYPLPSNIDSHCLRRKRLIQLFKQVGFLPKTVE